MTYVLACVFLHRSSISSPIFHSNQLFAIGFHVGKVYKSEKMRKNYIRLNSFIILVSKDIR